MTKHKASSSRQRSTRYLSDGHSTNTGVQYTCPGVGTHLAGEGELLPPADAVGLHRLPAWEKNTSAMEGQICCLSCWCIVGGGEGGGGGGGGPNRQREMFQVETSLECNRSNVQSHSSSAAHLMPRFLLCFTLHTAWHQINCLVLLHFLLKSEMGGGFFFKQKYHEIHFYAIWKRNCG